MTLVDAVLVLATLLCSLVAGFLFAFAAVVMPGIRNLDDAGFIRTFQFIDGVIQRNQPMFILVWVGSVLSLAAAAALGLWQLSGADRWLVVIAALVYVLGVQVPTLTVNVPLNNQLQKLDPRAINETTRKRAREVFESRWNRWNVFRTCCATVVSILLLVLLLRL